MENIIKEIEGIELKESDKKKAIQAKDIYEEAQVMKPMQMISFEDLD